MFAFAEETNIRTKRNERGKKKRSVSDTPVRPAVNMPGPVLAQSPRIVQRYPVEVMEGKVRSTPGRPAVPDTRAFLEEFYDQMKKIHIKTLLKWIIYHIIQTVRKGCMLLAVREGIA